MSQPWNPAPYQEEAVAWCVARAGGGLFLDPGLRKTSITLAVFKVLRKKGYVRAMLVVAPLRPCYMVWPAEAEKWDEFRDLKVSVLHGKDKDRLLREPADVYVINPDGLGWLTRELRVLKACPFDMLAVDESTKFKNTNTLRFRLLKSILHRFRRRYILTGTPAPRSLLDLFGQIYVVDMGKTFGPYITDFRRIHCYSRGSDDPNWLLLPGADEKIQKAVAPITLRMSEKDYLNLPPLVHNQIKVQLDKKSRELYDRMERDLFVQMDDGTINASNSGVASIKCRQIAAGGVKMDGGAPVLVHTLKAEAIQDLWEELGGKNLIVGYEFQHDLVRLKSVLGDIPSIDSDKSMKECKAIEKRWNAGEVPILLAQLEITAHGLNLQDTPADVAFHTNTYDLEVWDQFIRRVYRSGQKHKVIVHDIIVVDTVEEAVAEAKRRKGRTQTALLEALKEYRERRLKRNATRKR